LQRTPLPDLVLLDLMLPDMSGVDICRQIKQSETTRHIPVVMLTAKDEEIDRVVGFEVGADDYVVKPFSVRDFLFRICALLRRWLHQIWRATPAISVLVCYASAKQPIACGLMNKKCALRPWSSVYSIHF